MNVHPPFTGASLPLVAEPGGGIAGSPEALSIWAADERATLDGWLHRAGAVLFRGFGFADAATFRAFAEAVRPALRNYVGGDSPRHQVARQVYTSTEFPADLEIHLHNELSYAGWWPERLFFFCRIAAASGGETPLADGRRIYARMEPAVRRRFAERGIRYIQRLHDGNGPPGPGRSWQETFETAEAAAAEAHCRAAGASFAWTPRGLETTTAGPGVLTHPVTGEVCWFNQADQWHQASDGVKQRAGGAGEAACHATFGDGAPIAAADIAAVRAAYRACEVALPWAAGDVLVIDNRLALHGRKPFAGPREVLVAMA